MRNRKFKRFDHRGVLDSVLRVTCSQSVNKGEYQMKASLHRRALIGMVALGLALPIAVSAQTAADGLGQSWPNAQDVSLSPAWHVYVFKMNGIKFIQITDLTGTIIGAVGTANQQYITLPMGAYAQYVSTPQQPAAVPSGVTSAASSTVVYQDATTTLTVTPMTNGATATSLLACTNPVECNTNVVRQVQQ
jgi:hypothetical protein